MDKKTVKHLSYSGYNTYMSCPKKYDYHYNEKLKPESYPFHLLYGSALDAAMTEVLRGDSDAVALTFSYHILKKLYTDKVIYSKSDIDLDLNTEYSEYDLNDMLSSDWVGFTIQEVVDYVFNNIALGKEIDDKQKKAIDFILIQNTLEKIKLMLEGYHNYIEPRIEKVISIQEKVKRGILDFKAKVKDIEGEVIIDVKTSSRDYPNEAVLNSVQLAGYVPQKDGVYNGAYIVFNKNIRKNKTKVCGECGNNGTGGRHKTCNQLVNDVRCNGEWIEEITPEVIPQFIISEIPDHNIKMVESEYSKTEELIKNGVFPRNLNSCGQQFGQPCPYINLCWKGDYSGLVKEEK